MRSFEWLALVYFVYLGVMSWLRPLSATRRLQVTCGVLLSVITIVATARRGSLVVRDWAPLLYILAGYYLSGRTFIRPSHRLESWLASWDRRLLGDPTTRFSRWPRPVMVCLETTYMLCFLLLPAGFALLCFMGYAASADRYWTMVVAAEFGAFAPLTVFQTRPPWALEPAPVTPSPTVHRAVSYFVRHATIGANTFPSGHTSASLAIALAIAGPLPWAAVVFFPLALCVAIACVAGRYHYTIDVMAGAALGLLVWVVVAAMGL